MASEIRVDKITSLSGVGTITPSPTGIDIAGITTAATLRATTGIVTSLTAVSSAKVGSGVTLSPDGDIFATGVTTATTFSGSGASLTNLNASNIASGTVPTARLGSGTASSSTFLRGDSTFAAVTSTTINNNADNRLITGSGTANTLEGESTLTFDSGTLNVLPASGEARILVIGGEGEDARITLSADDGDDHIDQYNIESRASDNSFRIDQFSGGSRVDRLSIATEASDGDVTVHTGNLVIGTSGKGIDFSATGNGSGTMTSELLSDYEEGTFNPILQNGNNGYRFQYGMYRKVGNAVHFTAFIETSATPPSSNIAIGGLPYTSANDSNANAYVFPMLTNRTSFGTNGGLYARFYMWPNTTYAQLYYPVNSSSSNFETVNADQMNAANASNVWMSGTYFTE